MDNKNNECQQIISTLIRAKKACNDSIFVRELVNIPNDTINMCSELKLKEMISTYHKYIGDEGIERLKNYNENLMDINKVRHVNAIFRDKYINELCKHLTWKSWFEII